MEPCDKVVSIVIQRRFEAAHFLTLFHDKAKDEILYGNCAGLHGHSYLLEVGVSGTVDENGMVMNFRDLKRMIDGQITNVVDHQLLNECLEFDGPMTAENMVLYWFDLLQTPIASYGGCWLKFIRLWETETAYAEVSCEDQ